MLWKWRRKRARAGGCKNVEAYLVPQFGKRTNERTNEGNVRRRRCWRALGADAVGGRGTALRTCSPSPSPPPPPPPPMLQCCWNFQCIGILTDPAVAAARDRRNCCCLWLWWNSAVFQHCPSVVVAPFTATADAAPFAEIRNEDSRSRLTIVNATAACSPWALLARPPARPTAGPAGRPHS